MALNVKKILVPINGHKAGEEAFRLACELSRHSKRGCTPFISSRSRTSYR